jgi:hypothetical protein
VEIKCKSSNSVRIDHLYLLKFLIMEYGFIVDITNNTNQTKEVQLFTSSLPEGVLVNTMDKVYNFDALQKMAQKNTFVGNSITTGFEEGLHIEIVNKVKIEKVILNGRYESPQIRINGTDEYVLVVCPPNSSFYLRLNKLPL